MLYAARTEDVSSNFDMYHLHEDRTARKSCFRDRGYARVRLRVRGGSRDEMRRAAIYI